MIERKTVTVMYILSYYETVIKGMLAKLSVPGGSNDPSHQIEISQLFRSYNSQGSKESVF